MKAISEFTLKGVRWGEKSDFGLVLAIKRVMEQGNRTRSQGAEGRQGDSRTRRKKKPN